VILSEAWLLAANAVSRSISGIVFDWNSRRQDAGVLMPDRGGHLAGTTMPNPLMKSAH
jgi:hypothetical protein